MIATWGAVTGSLALFLEWRKWLRDRGRLRIVAAIRADDTVPPGLGLHAEVTNIGRRPVRFIRYALERPWIPFLAWRFAPWRIVYRKTNPDFVELQEAKQESLRFAAPQELLRVSHRLRIVDTLGRSWRSKPISDGARLIKEGSVAPIEELELGTPGEPGFVRLGLYPPAKGSDRYRLQGWFYGTVVGSERRQVKSSYVDLNAARDAFGGAANFAQEFHDKRGAVKPPPSFGRATGSHARPL